MEPGSQAVQASEFKEQKPLSSYSCPSGLGRWNLRFHRFL